MAGTPANPLTQLTPQALKMILDQSAAMPLNRGTAAALTIAFAILKTDHLSRGETISDDLVKQEVQKIYSEMLGIADPQIALQRAQQPTRRP